MTRHCVVRAHDAVARQEVGRWAEKSPVTTFEGHPVQISRRKLLQASAIGGAALAAPGALAFSPVPTTTRSSAGIATLLDGAPQTGFEETGTWTTHDDELAFIAKLADAPNEVVVEVRGTTAQGRPIHGIRFGQGATQNAIAKESPVVMLLGSQHGNEPSGRDANLILIRDLAWADLDAPENADLARILRDQTLIVVPSANPDGREAGTRANANGFDINRDHLRLSTEEARTFADIINEWAPYMALDLHEYGPSVPVVYDDDVLYLWPRNLNVDEGVRTMAQEYCEQYIKVDCEAAGYTADEYGLYKVGPNVAQQPVGGTTNDFALQMAGGSDPGICRNAMGLRNTMGILTESRVTVNPQQSPEELVLDGEGGSLYGDSRAARIRRVDSQRVILDSMLRFMREQGEAAAAVTRGAAVRKAQEGAERSAPVYFGGQDDQRPLQSGSTSAAPASSAYRVTAADLEGDITLENGGTGSRREAFLRAVEGQAVAVEEEADGSLFISLAQAAVPIMRNFSSIKLRNFSGFSSARVSWKR